MYHVNADNVSYRAQRPAGERLRLISSRGNYSQLTFRVDARGRRRYGYAVPDRSTPISGGKVTFDRRTGQVNVAQAIRGPDYRPPHRSVVFSQADPHVMFSR
jgi:hypothetical protein